MAKIDLSAVDICRIIKQCAGANVASLQFGNLHLTFHSHRNESAAAQRQGVDSSVVPTEVAPAPQMNLMDEESFIQAEEAQLLIDDPLGFEKAQIERAIERNRTQ